MRELPVNSSFVAATPDEHATAAELPLSTVSAAVAEFPGIPEFLKRAAA